MSYQTLDEVLLFYFKHFSIPIETSGLHIVGVFFPFHSCLLFIWPNEACCSFSSCFCPGDELSAQARGFFSVFQGFFNICSKYFHTWCFELITFLFGHLLGTLPSFTGAHAANVAGLTLPLLG